MWAAGTRTALGHLLLETGPWRDAQAAVRDDLARRPGNGWALHGLRQAQLAQGPRDDAAAIGQQIGRAWPSADPALKSAGIRPADPRRPRARYLRRARGCAAS